MTPLMQQYHAIKERYPAALLMFQVGDFYELFYDDAKQAAAFLGITLTKRGKSDGEPIPLCGVPCHTVEHYVIKLVHGGFSVVICDQQSVAEPGRLVERSVSRVFTPGTLHAESLLEPRVATLIGALMVDDHQWSMVLVEVITGRWQLAVVPAAARAIIEAELVGYGPKEIVVDRGATPDHVLSLIASLGSVVTHLSATTDDGDDASFGASHDAAWKQRVLVGSVRDLYEQRGSAQRVIDLMYRYLAHHVPEVLGQMRPLQLYVPDEYLLLDSGTQRHLELVVPLHEKGVTLLDAIDYTVTAMGSRLMRSWILRPLRNRHAIESRLAAVSALCIAHTVRQRVRALVRLVGDMERIVGRIMLQRAVLHDYRMLSHGLAQIGPLLKLLQEHGLEHLCRGSVGVVEELLAVYRLLTDALVQDSDASHIIRSGYHADLDRYRALAEDGAAALAAHEDEERRATGIASLKIRSQGPHGYAIEVTKTHRESVPERYRLVQSLVNRDRFSTDALQVLVAQLEAAHEQVSVVEAELLRALQQAVYERGPVLRICADEMAMIDVYAAFAEAAVLHKYTRPIFTDAKRYAIGAGRHPVVEQLQRCSFIPNDLLVTEHERLWVITGPNMGGKSTFMRQAALIAIMAQAGSFVPAAAVTMPLFDRICTRIGASDNLSGGKSTFMVEMEEVARLCMDATGQSLIILDEIGRGTATYDGIAIAQAVLEYIDEQVGCLALCATHYHELARRVAVPGRSIGAYCSLIYYGSSESDRTDPVITYTVRPGIAEGSFGIAVAERAGMPATIVTRARDLLGGM